MANLNDEMKLSADYAIKAAKVRFRQDFDYSEQSIAKLEKLLGQIYWGFSSHTKEEGDGGVIYNTAIIWGSYLGEYMRLKWGGTWILKGSDRLLSINNKEFSPINFVYQKITSNPDSSVEKYLSVSESKLKPAPVIPKPSQKPAPVTPISSQKPAPVIPTPSPKPEENIIQQIRPIPFEQTKTPLLNNKRLLYILAGVGGLLAVISICIIGYTVIKTGGVSAFGFGTNPTSTYTGIPIENTLVTATFFSTNTQPPTVTILPTNTPSPTYTPSPSYTPSLTFTPIVTLTPTETPKPFTPTPTRTTIRTRTPTKTPIPPTEPPQPTATPQPSSTATKPPPPTNTQPPPVELVSCEVNPDTVPAGEDTPLRFTAHFSAPGYGFDAVINDPEVPGANGCHADPGNQDISCDGSSGLVPGSHQVAVTFISSVGNCDASYSSLAP